MSDKSSIEWTDATWNPVRGCDLVSAGCKHCYAMRLAGRFPWGRHLTKKDSAGRVTWNGKIDLVEESLTLPLRWRAPRRIFVTSGADLFHPAVPDEWIDRIFAVMALAPRHTFQVLTKRPERMRKCVTTSRGMDVMAAAMRTHSSKTFDWPGWPLPNVWLGVSVEDQATADKRIPLLLQTSAAVRFVSYEPALDRVEFRPAWMRAQRGCGGTHRGPCGEGLHHHHDEFCGPRLDQIIVGGESGPGARPFDVAWARSTVAQCKAAGVACFVKQLGTFGVDRDPATWHAWSERGVTRCDGGPGDGRLLFRDPKGGDMAEWPEDLRVREFPAGVTA